MKFLMLRNTYITLNSPGHGVEKPKGDFFLSLQGVGSGVGGSAPRMFSKEKILPPPRPADGLAGPSEPTLPEGGFQEAAAVLLLLLLLLFPTDGGVGGRKALAPQARLGGDGHVGAGGVGVVAKLNRNRGGWSSTGLTLAAALNSNPVVFLAHPPLSSAAAAVASLVGGG